MQTFLKHVGGWLAVYVLYTLMFSYWEDDFWSIRDLALINLVNVPLFAIAYYTLANLQIPYLWKKQRYVLFVISAIASSLFIASICRLVGLWFMNDLVDYTYKPPFLSMKGYIAKTIRFYTPAVILLAWMNHVRQRKENERLMALQKEKLDTELKYLKAQINPHFLFNTLNNLYSFVVSNSPKAPEMVLQLSAMLDYVLYQSQPDQVPLEKEVEAIRNFIALEQIRYGERLTVNVNVQIDSQSTVAPLLLLSVVENAFKHGASGDITTPEINIDITAKQNEVGCVVENTKSEKGGSKTDAFKKGIGLKNIRRQLSLIYPERHELQIEESEDFFRIKILLHATK